ncbi:sialate O-acetylesterase [Kiritimatiellaeota bacterium B1221]|nr:sialate O-acetylesterase [Kiritimatiellaeota bacterium B1221]
MKSSSIFWCILLPFFCQFVHAQLSINGCVSDYMVLQRERTIPFRGKAKPQSQVQISFAGNTDVLDVDGDGNWQTEFPAMSAGGPYELTVSSLDEKLHFTDLLIGDVWVCAGQSNMQLSLGSQPDFNELLKDADQPHIRYLALPVFYADQPKNTKTDKKNWQKFSPELLKQMSGVAYHFAANLQPETGVPIGIVKASKGGSFIEGWIPEWMFEQTPELQGIPERWQWLKENEPQLKARQQARLDEWKADHESSFKAWVASDTPGPFMPPKPPLPPGAKHLGIPGKIYNGVIHPVTAHPVKGVVWYQGESNSDRGYFYRTLLQALVLSWRRAWDQADLPFVIVQLPNYDHTQNPYGPQDGGPWAPVRESQSKVQDLPDTSYVVTLGLGNNNDVHPRDKSEVGRRAAINALEHVYDQKILGTSPQVKEVEISKESLILHFRDAGDGLRTLDQKKPRGFQIAGEDQKFYPATADMIAPDQIRVSAPQVLKPVAVRHAWSSTADFNVVNSAGLPFSTYRTDSWPVPNQQQTQPFWWLEL